jgi:hypothetical protein
MSQEVEMREFYVQKWDYFMVNCMDVLVAELLTARLSSTHIVNFEKGTISSSSAPYFADAIFSSYLAVHI